MGAASACSAQLWGEGATRRRALALFDQDHAPRSLGTQVRTPPMSGDRPFPGFSPPLASPGSSWSPLDLRHACDRCQENFERISCRLKERTSHELKWLPSRPGLLSAFLPRCSAFTSFPCLSQPSPVSFRSPPRRRRHHHHHCTPCAMSSVPGSSGFAFHHEPKPRAPGMIALGRKEEEALMKEMKARARKVCEPQVSGG